MLRHRTDVEVIAAQVRELYHQQEPFRINHGSTNSTRRSVLERKRTIDISHLKYVLDVNVESRTVRVEPNVSMDRLAETTLKYGLIPPVVMEFPGITVGGGYAGTSGESSSFKYGFFDRTIIYVEMILADGKLVTASKTEKADLFHGAAGACGSLGIITLVELQLIEAKKWRQPIIRSQACQQLWRGYSNSSKLKTVTITWMEFYSRKTRVRLSRAASQMRELTIMRFERSITPKIHGSTCM
jgi:delta24-sterol reductase